eukprot:GHVS01034475.1.p1 GENE.GHVS01034475.1~~GHVS01034475.1.p1  ORF type:complete len:232 (+),score=25.63 GHVS01034475.1:246-941(+)
MKPDDSSREGLANYWDYSKVEPSDERKWFPLLVGAQLKAESDAYDEQFVRAEVGLYMQDGNRLTQDISFEESEGHIGRKEGGLTAKYDLLKSSYVTERKFSVNGVETRIWLANASPEHNEDDSWVESFQDRNGWMEPSANCEGTKTNKSGQWVMTFSAVEKRLNYVVIQVDGKKLFVIKPRKLLITYMPLVHVVMHDKGTAAAVAAAITKKKAERDEGRARRAKRNEHGGT